MALKRVLVALAVGLTFSAFAATVTDPRYCSTTQSQSASRSGATVKAFRRIHACPGTGLTTGACAGWVVDHPIPLACGGCDSIMNMQWMRTADAKAKDGWEREVYGAPGSALCPFKAQP